MIVELPEDVWDVYRSKVPRGLNPEKNDKEAWRIREKIIVSYVYLTSRVVAKMKKKMPAHVEKDDLESRAKEGLLQAVTRYDHTLNVPFEAFATQRMRSCIMDGIREQDWAPRSLRKKQRELRLGEEVFTKDEGREPTQAELAQRLEISVEELERTKHLTAIASHTYIEANTEAQNKAASLNPEEDDLVALMKSIAASALKDLPLVNAAVIALHYYEEKKLAEVAQLLKISEAKVGTLHEESVVFIWGRLQEALKDD